MSWNLKHSLHWSKTLPESRESAGPWPALAAVQVIAVAALLGLGTTGGALGQAGLTVPKPEAPSVKELEVTLPRYPDSETLIRFPTDRANGEVWVDGKTLSTDNDGVVRYALMIRSAGGAENTSFEGLRCATGERRVYAYGRKTAAATTWAPSRVSVWTLIEDHRINRYHFEFWRDVFCRDHVMEPRAVILDNLARGGRGRPYQGR